MVTRLSSLVLILSGCGDNRAALMADAALSGVFPVDAALLDSTQADASVPSDASVIPDAPKADAAILGCGEYVFPDAILNQPYVVPVSDIYRMPFARFQCGIGTLRPSDDSTRCTFSITDTFDKLVWVEVWDVSDVLVLDCSATIHVRP